VFTVAAGGGIQVTPPQPRPGVVAKRLKVFKSRLLEAVGTVNPISMEQFIDTYRGSGRKVRIYTSAFLSLTDKKLTIADAMISAFIKDEKTNLSRKDDPCPRIIQPRSARFNIAIGVHLKPMEKPIFRGIAEVFGGVTVMKGLNAAERGREAWRKWRRFSNPVAVLLDATRFDQHCSEDVINWEHRLEESVAGDRASLKELNAMRKTNVCYARAHDADIKYKVSGKRMSGDMDTALGNCMTMCGMTWSFMRWLKIRKFEYMNDGDDGVLMIEKENLTAVLDSFREYFLDLGFTMKLEGVAYEMEQVEFCQARPIYDGTEWRFVRDPEICLAKDSLTLKRCTSVEEITALSNAVGWCGAALAGDMPIFHAFYQQMIRGKCPESGEILTGMQMMAKRMDPKFSPPTAEARVSFWKAYGLSPDTQLAIETQITESAYTLRAPSPDAITTLLFDIRTAKDTAITQT
jgi:hypothetical protein